MTTVTSTLETMLMQIPYLANTFTNDNEIQKLLVPRTQQTWRQEFLGSRSSTVEQPSTRTAAAGTFLQFI